MTELHYLRRFTFPWGLSLRLRVVANVVEDGYAPVFNTEENYDRYLPKRIPWRYR